MSIAENCLYWFGKDKPKADYFQNTVALKQPEQLPDVWGGAICINFENQSEQTDLLTKILHLPKLWSWSIYVVHRSAFSDCVTDGVYDEYNAYHEWKNINQKIAALTTREQIDPLTGWLGINRSRRLSALRQVSYSSIYRYPIVEIFYPELYSTYKFVYSETMRGTLEAEQLVDRIRVCNQCNSGHLNYIEVCPDCKSIDIEVQSSLHCFTCGHVADQQSFIRTGKLECPKCLTQLRHIGVDYDRPLESYVCNACTHRFVEAETVSHCLECDNKTPAEDLIIRKIHQLKLGQMGEYVYKHGKRVTAPEISIKGKVESAYFENLLLWINKVAIRHKETHMLLSMHISGLDDYSKQYGEVGVHSLLEQITNRLDGLFRDTDICCQYRHGVLLIFMPHTPMEHMPALQDKIEKLGKLIEDDLVTLHIHTKSIPDHSMNSSVKIWLETHLGEIHASE